MSRVTSVVALVLVGFVAACSDATTAPPLERPSPPSRDLRDSSQPSWPVPGFYLLVPTLTPPPSKFAGTFDPALSPQIDICALASDNPQSPSACSTPTIASLSMTSPPPQKVTLDAKAENYNANWTANVTVGKQYRAVVSAGGRTLGYVDLQGVKKQGNTVPSGFVAVVAGKPFLFKFRIETGIAGSIALSPATATLRDADTPAQSQLYTASVLDLHGAPLGGKTVTWSASNASVVALNPASGATSPSGQVTTTATTIGRVGTSTDVVITATLQGLSATSTLTVLPTAGRPIAVADAYGVVAGTSLVVAAPGVLGNDLDPDGDPISVAGVTDNVDHGTLALQSDGSFTYTPAAGFTGTDSFAYTAVDPSSLTSFPATVTIQVITPSNLGPVANDDRYAVVEGTTLAIAAPGILANDTDPNGEALSATLITSNVSHGSLVAFPDGHFNYTPSAGYTGPDAFTYQMQDASGHVAQANVTIDVLADPDKAPVAVADLYSLIEGTTLARTAPGFLGNDSDPDGAAISATLITSSVAHGSLVAFPDGHFGYTPDAGYTGTDAFTYQMQDASGNIAQATVTLQVLPATTTDPIANADSYVAYDGSVLQISKPGFLDNDLDPDGEPLTATLITSNVSHGSLVAFPDGSFSYTPSAGYAGPDAFTYRMQDASGHTADGTVTIQVLSDPDEKPVGVADLYTTFAGKTLSVAAAGFLANDIDPDGAALTATLISDNVDHGSLVAFPDGSFSYAPSAGFTGTDAFSYKMQDASGHASDPVVVTIDVRPDPNQPPLGLPDHYAMLGGTTLAIASPGFLANDLDPEGEAITATLITDNVDNGSVVAFPDGSFTYTPKAGFVGTDSFSYQMQDASSHASVATTVTIDVLDPAIVSSAGASARVAERSVTVTSGATDRRVGGGPEPLRVGSADSYRATTDAPALTPASPSARAGRTPLTTRAGTTRTPALRYRLDPALFSSGRIPLPVARNGQR